MNDIDRKLENPPEDGAIDYFPENKSPRDWEKERQGEHREMVDLRAANEIALKDADANRAKKADAEAANAARNKDLTERAMAATVKTDDDGTMRDAAGNVTGTKNADGTVTPNPDNEAIKHIVRRNGVLYWDNGHMVGRGDEESRLSDATKKLQADMDARTEALLVKLRKDNPNHLGDTALLNAWGERQYQRYRRAQRAAAQPPSATAQPGAQPAAAGAAQPAAKSWNDAVKQQSNDKVNGVLAQQKAFNDANAKRISEQKMKKGRREAATGSLISNALNGIRSIVESGDAITPENGYKIMTREATDNEGNKVDHRYVVYAPITDAITETNNERRKHGASGDFKNFYAAIEINNNGRVMKDAQPVLFADFSEDGKGSAENRTLRTFTMKKAEEILFNAYKNQGFSDEDARNTAYGMLEGFGTKPQTSDKMAVEQMKQENMNKRAQMRDDQQTRKMELAKQELEEKIQKRLATANTADERNRILNEAKQAEIELQRESIDAKYAQMALQFGSGDAKQKAKEKVAQKLDGGDQAAIKPGDNSGDDDAQSAEYPGYTNGKAKRALKAGWKWNAKTQRFEKPEGK